MASATPQGATAPEPPRSGRLVVVGIDRSRQFLRAKRHTFMVKTLRRLFPLMTIGALGLYGFSALSNANWGSSLGLDTIARILPENLTMNNPHYEGFTADGSAYTVDAKTAQQDLRRMGVIRLNGITGHLTDKKKSRTDFAAARGTFDSNKSILVLTGGINITSKDGLNAKLQSATIRTKRGLITSKQPVEVTMPSGKVTSNKLTIRQKEKLALFIGNVRTTLKPNSGAKSDPNSKPGGKPEKKAATSTPAMLGTSDEPVKIASTRLNVDRAKGNARFRGNVRAVQGDQSLKTSIMEVRFEPDTKKAKKSADGTPEAADNDPMSGASRIKRIIVPKPLILRRGELEQVTGKRAVFDAENQLAEIKGNIVMSAGPTRKAVADVANIDSGRDTILLTGNVLVNQDANELRGDRLFIDRAGGTSKLTALPAADGKPGRIYAKLARGSADGADGGKAGRGKAKGGKKAAKKAVDAAKKAAKPGAKSGAAATAMSMTAFKGDPNAPIDIVANSLDVFDKRKQAVFHGNVDVVQGQINMKTAKLTAFYTGSSNLVSTEAVAAEDKKNKKGAGKKGAAKQAGNEVTRIKATGKVVVNSKVSGQSATGDWADIDMKANTVKLGGDVILKRGKNIIRATSLKIDLESGNAIIETTPEEAGSGWASTMQPATKGAKAIPLQTIRGGRPSAVFYPTQLQGNSKPGAKKNGKTAGAKNKAKAGGANKRANAARRAVAPRPAASSSWEATTEPTAN
ncbi:MAG: LPS export ABC transporter periplasmic protein LptC [Alphaproteobacteria bacterium]|nr:LPS export ABC transporter periplasmic protein LptC [Alphaproteobacteria bacterium]